MVKHLLKNKTTKIDKNAKIAPISDDVSGECPADIGSPPKYAPIALPRLKATCTIAPPRSSPPGEYSMSMSCIGDERAKRQDADMMIDTDAVQMLKVSK